MIPPDPAVTASIYCDRGLEGVVRGALVPFAREIDARHPGRWRLWFVRYARRGEHVKVRLHGPSVEAEEVRSLLGVHVRTHLDAFPSPAELPRVSRPDAPAVDPDDEGEGDHPDRALRWTAYRRSHVSLGPPALLDDDGYVARMAACLAHGAELALEAASADDAASASARQRTLLGALVAGLAAPGFMAGERIAYLRYHRDWLVRFQAGAAGEVELARALDRQADAMAAAVAQLARVTGEAWTGDAPPGTELGGAVAALAAHLDPSRASAADPFASDGRFPPLFKVFHGLANQLGLSAVHEALAHHLLVRAGAPAGAPAG